MKIKYLYCYADTVLVDFTPSVGGVLGVCQVITSSRYRRVQITSAGGFNFAAHAPRNRRPNAPKGRGLFAFFLGAGSCAGGRRGSLRAHGCPNESPRPPVPLRLRSRGGAGAVRRRWRVVFAAVWVPFSLVGALLLGFPSLLAPFCWGFRL